MIIVGSVQQIDSGKFLDAYTKFVQLTGHTVNSSHVASLVRVGLGFV